MNIKDIVTYEQATALKKSGFDYPCRHYYAKEDAPDGSEWLTFGCNENHNAKSPRVSAPTIYQAAKWLREEYGQDIVVSPRFDSTTGDRIGYFWRRPQRTDLFCDITYSTYEVTLSRSINSVLGLD